MATQRDLHMAKIVAAISRGAGTTHLSDEAMNALHDRYAYWLELPVASQGNRSPLAVWSQHGDHFLDRLTAIGKKAAESSGGGEISAQVATASAQTVEADSPCPYCLANNPGANPPG